MSEFDTSNVFATFKMLLEEIDVEIDLFNQVVMRASERRDYSEARNAVESAHQANVIRDKIVSLQLGWEALTIKRSDKAVGDMIPTERRNYASQKVKRTTPISVSILGQYFTVHSWRGVLEQTMNTIADVKPEKFEQIMQRFPHYIGRDEMRFTKSKELKNGIFIEVNLSSASILRLCFQVLETIGLSREDLVIETV